MLAVAAAGLTGGETVFDVCAAPGGKSFLAADRLIALEKECGRSGKVFSFDLTKRKTDLIREGAERLGLDNIETAERDARQFFAQDEGKADVVLCDLPCSGLGVIGKTGYQVSRQHGGARLAAGPAAADPDQCGALSQEGGVLIYSTCTINREENQDNAAWIEKELGLQPEDLTPYLPAHIPGIQSNMIQLLPHVHGTDGFFISRFRKA